MQQLKQIKTKSTKKMEIDDNNQDVKTTPTPTPTTPTTQIGKLQKKTKLKRNQNSDNNPKQMGKYMIIKQIETPENVKITYIYDQQNRLHHLKKPALVIDFGHKVVMKWFYQGNNRIYGYSKPHTITHQKNVMHNGFVIPVVITRYFFISDKDEMKSIERQNEKGEIHSVHDSIPATEKIQSNKTCLTWYKNGKIHRDFNRPAFVNRTTQNFAEILEWYQNGILQKRMKFMQNTEFTSYEWFDEDLLLHRNDDKPSYIYIDNFSNIKEERYYKHGLRHRIHGPAITISKSNKSVQSWCLFDSNITNKLYLTKFQKQLLSSFNWKSKMCCYYCFDIIRENDLPLECGHWIHRCCFGEMCKKSNTNTMQSNNKKQQDVQQSVSNVTNPTNSTQCMDCLKCLECNATVSADHQHFLKTCCQYFQ